MVYRGTSKSRNVLPHVHLHSLINFSDERSQIWHCNINKWIDQQNILNSIHQIYMKRVVKLSIYQQGKQYGFHLRLIVQSWQWIIISEFFQNVQCDFEFPRTRGVIIIAICTKGEMIPVQNLFHCYIQFEDRTPYQMLNSPSILSLIFCLFSSKYPTGICVHLFPFHTIYRGLLLSKFFHAQLSTCLYIFPFHYLYTPTISQIDAVLFSKQWSRCDSKAVLLHAWYSAPALRLTHVCKNMWWISLTFNLIKDMFSLICCYGL